MAPATSSLLRLSSGAGKAGARSTSARRSSPIFKSFFSAIQRSEQDPGTVAARELALLLYPGHPYSRPAVGTIESVKRITREQVGGEVREAAGIPRIVHGARPHVEPHHHDGDGRALGHEEHHAVGQDLAMGKGGGGGGQGQRRHEQAHREPETSHEGSPQSRVFLNFNTAREKMTIPNTSSGTRLGQR